MKKIDSSQLVSAVAESYLASLRQRGVKAASLASHMRALQTMVGPFGDLPLASLTPAAIQQVMASAKSPEKARRLLQAWKAFFAWAREQGYEAADPTSGLIPQSARRPLPPTPYTSEEVRQILSTLENPADLAAVALVAFAGLRPSEIAGLNFRGVGDDHITVRSGKLQALRRVTITPTLRPWLVPFLGTEEFCQLPTTMAIARRAQAAGICLKFHRLRLSFIAYRLAVTGDVHLVAQEAGVTPILHLKGLYGNLEEAKEFWALTPEACNRANWTQTVRDYLAAWFKRKSSSSGPNSTLPPNH
jgi:integrase